LSCVGLGFCVQRGRFVSLFAPPGAPGGGFLVRRVVMLIVWAISKGCRHVLGTPLSGSSSPRSL